MKNRFFKIQKKELIEFLRSKKDNKDFICPKDLKNIEIKPDGNDKTKGYLTVFIEV